MDLLLTDPPYNVDYQGTAGKIKNDNMEDTAFRRFLTGAFANAAMVMKPGAPFYIWHADSEGYNFRGAICGADGLGRFAAKDIPRRSRGISFTLQGRISF